MENLTGGTPPVRYLPCVVPCKLYFWDDYGKVDWYVYHPTRQDYEKFSNAVSDYLEVFQDMSQSANQQWAQTM